MQVLCHRANTEVLAAVHDICKAGKGGTSEYWCWKALTQLRDLIIYHAKDAEALNALDALLTGEATLSTALSMAASCTCLYDAGQQSLRDYGSLRSS